MANQILQIMATKDLREELVQHGKLAARKFTWEAHARAVAEAYHSVVQRWV
jgi:glycosyltransferase involved in cell wall biosynthesis